MIVTNEKMKILMALASGPKTHGQLRLAYYGEERCKNPSNTSFYNQLQRMMEAELIQKTMVGMYSITDIGRKQYR
jgi:predicted transcriptional regulator